MGKISNYFVPIIFIVSVILFVSGVIKKIDISRKAHTKLIAVIPTATMNSWWEIVHKGAMKAAEDFNVKITWTGPEIDTDRERQIQIINDCLVQNVDAVVLAANDPDALVRSVDKIMASRIPCILMDTKINSNNFHCFVGIDNYVAGVQSAKVLGKAMGGRGEVIIVKFLQGSIPGMLRANGFIDTITKEFPGIKIVAEQHTFGVEDARQKTADMITSHPTAKAVYAVNQPAGVGAFKAIDTLNDGRQILFVGIDSDPVLVEGMERGKVTGIVTQNPFEIGYQGVKQAVDKLSNKKISRTVLIPTLVVTRENLSQMKRDYASALGLL